MEPLTAALIATVVLVLGGVAYFYFFRKGKGKLNIKTKLGSLSFKGENPPPPSAVPGGVKITGSEAGRDIKARSSSVGGVAIEKTKAGGEIQAMHTPDDPPPKA